MFVYFLSESTGCFLQVRDPKDTVYYRSPSWDVSTEELFYRQVGEISGNFQILEILEVCRR